MAEGGERAAEGGLKQGCVSEGELAFSSVGWGGALWGSGEHPPLGFLDTNVPNKECSILSGLCGSWQGGRRSGSDCSV